MRSKKRGRREEAVCACVCAPCGRREARGTAGRAPPHPPPRRGTARFLCRRVVVERWWASGVTVCAPLLREVCEGGEADGDRLADSFYLLLLLRPSGGCSVRCGVCARRAVSAPPSSSSSHEDTVADLRLDHGVADERAMWSPCTVASRALRWSVCEEGALLSHIEEPKARDVERGTHCRAWRSQMAWQGGEETVLLRSLCAGTARSALQQS